MPAVDRWEMLRAQDLRIAAVSYRLSLANRALCARALAPQPGFVLHGIAQYGAADRAEAARHYGLGAYPGVLAVVAGSPAQRAGLAPDDQLISLNGRMLDSRTVADLPTRARVEEAQAIIIEAMGTSPVTLRISRAGRRIDLSFAAESGCTSNAELVPGEAVNAWADGGRVVIGGGLLARCPTDDDLALVIAHEMAHNILRHGGRLGLKGSGSAEMRETEEEADALAVRLASAAAYDLRNAETFLGGLLAGDGAPRAAPTHPDTKRRLALLRAAILNL